MKKILDNRFNIALILIAYCAYIVGFIHSMRIIKLNEQYISLLQSESGVTQFEGIRHAIEASSQTQSAGGVIFLIAILWISWRIGWKLEFKLKSMFIGYGYILLIAFIPIIFTTPFNIQHTNLYEIFYSLFSTLAWISIMFLYITVHKYFRKRVEKSII